MKTIAFLITTPSLMFMETGEYNGYVAVPPEHPLYGKGYDEPEVDNLDVHGGVTFADTADKLPPTSEYLDHKEPPRDWWVFGFDTCHHDDNPDKWNCKTVASETRKLQAQLENLFAKIRYNS